MSAEHGPSSVHRDQPKSKSERIDPYSTNYVEYPIVPIDDSHGVRIQGSEDITQSQDTTPGSKEFEERSKKEKQSLDDEIREGLFGSGVFRGLPTDEELEKSWESRSKNTNIK